MIFKIFCVFILFGQRSELKRPMSCCDDLFQLTTSIFADGNPNSDPVTM